MDTEPPAPGTIITGPGAATATESKEPDAEEAPKAAGAEPKERARKDEEKKKDRSRGRSRSRRRRRDAAVRSDAEGRGHGVRLKPTSPVRPPSQQCPICWQWVASGAESRAQHQSSSARCKHWQAQKEEEEMEERARLRQRRRGEEQEGKGLCPRCGRSIRVSDLFATFQHYESCHPRFTDADLPPALLARVRAGSRRTRARTPGPSTPAETRRRRSPTADPPAIVVAVVKAALDHLSGQQKRHQSHQ